MDVICGNQKASCFCNKPANHEDDIHVCNCAGSWKTNGDIISFPAGITDPFNPIQLMGMYGLFPNPILVNEE